MGCYDTVHFRCPVCDEPLEFQTKAGDCELSEYRSHSVPLAIADCMSEATVSCTACVAKIRFRVNQRRVPVFPELMHPGEDAD